MQFDFTGVCRLTLEHTPGKSTSKHVATDFFLELGKGLHHSIYLDENGIPTKEGSHVLTNIFVQGLIGNIHAAHDKGYRDGAEHLRYIIEKLEEGFASVYDVEEREF
jgi:hypothetical protein